MKVGSQWLSARQAGALLLMGQTGKGCTIYHRTAKDLLILDLIEPDPDTSIRTPSHKPYRLTRKGKVFVRDWFREEGLEFVES